MNKGFSHYFSKAWFLSFYSFKKCSFKTKCLLALYHVLAFIGKLLFVTRPLFVVADNNLANMIDDAHNISFEKMFHGVSRKKYVDLMLSYLLDDSLIVVTFVACCGVPLTILLLSYEISIAIIVFLSLMGALSLVVSYFILMNMSPLGYIAQKTEGLEFSDYLYNSKESVKKSRGTIFLCELIPTLIKSAVLAVFVVSFYFVYAKLYLNPNVTKLGINIFGLILLGIYVALMLAYFCIVSPINNVKATSMYLLFKDIAHHKKPIMVKPVTGTNVGYAAVFKDQKTDAEALDFNISKADKEEK